MNHKHRRPRARRAGCKACKPWKNGYEPGLTYKERRAKYFAERDMKEDSMS